MVNLSNHQVKDVLFRLDQLQSQIASFQTFFSAAVHFISSQLHITIDENEEAENGNKLNFSQKAENT